MEFYYLDWVFMLRLVLRALFIGSILQLSHAIMDVGGTYTCGGVKSFGHLQIQL